MPGAEQAILAERLRKAAQPVADDARLRSARWSRRVPLSVRPQAYTFEGRADGRPIAHPVYARGPRIRGPLVNGRHVPPGWTWVKQIPVRPFLREAIDAKQDEMVRIFAGIVDDWAKQLGYK